VRLLAATVFVALSASAAAMSVDELVAALEREVAAAPSAWVRADFEQLARTHSFRADAATLQQYLRVKLVFEAVREAGWWRIAWDVTDREPRSDAIWSAWKRAQPSSLATATAECDESSALAAFLLRRLGVRSVGLLWPMSNHTVAVWKVARERGGEARVVLPTSQIFLAPTTASARAPSIPPCSAPSTTTRAAMPSVPTRSRPRSVRSSSSAFALTPAQPMPHSASYGCCERD